jgi:midasin (ATPase involved in ribosome maturation)
MGTSFAQWRTSSHQLARNSPCSSIDKIKLFKAKASALLKARAERLDSANSTEAAMDLEPLEVTPSLSKRLFGVSPFFIPRGPSSHGGTDLSFTFQAPTTQRNALKLLRALQLRKPVLLEGSPGVGKTSLVSALAKASGHNCLRINLSDQTDVSDLFGADLPVEGGKGGEFAWRDGPFLRALRAGHWVLLDELNLASQSVLEGLNACFDHRGEVYVPELGAHCFFKLLVMRLTRQRDSHLSPIIFSFLFFFFFFQSGIILQILQ